MLLFSITISCDSLCLFFFFFFNDTATTEIYTLSLHDALPISTTRRWLCVVVPLLAPMVDMGPCLRGLPGPARSEEHTSELQSPCNLVCRLLLEKKKKTQTTAIYTYITQHHTLSNRTSCVAVYL